jgi:hypothetical protein
MPSHDSLLANAATERDWPAKQHAKEMRVGDDVVLWQGKGINPKGAGVVEWARIASLPAKRPDTSPDATHWMDYAEASRPEYRLANGRNAPWEAFPLQHPET